MRKWPYLAHFSLKWKNKTTLFCQTFKVEEKKVVSFFKFELNQARYGHLLVFNIFALMSPFVKFEPPCGTPKSASIWLKLFLVYILMYWNGINNLLSTFEKLFEIWSTLPSDPLERHGQTSGGKHFKQTQIELTRKILQGDTRAQSKQTSEGFPSLKRYWQKNRFGIDWAH